MSSPKQLFVYILLLLFAQAIYSDEYSATDVKSGLKTTSVFFNQTGVPDLVIKRQCQQKKKNAKCWQLIVNSAGKEFHYAIGHSISQISKGRYRDKVYLLITERWQKGKKSVSSTYLIDDKFKKTSFNKSYKNVLSKGFWGKKRSFKMQTIDSKVTRNGNLLVLYRDGLLEINRAGKVIKKVETPEELESGKIGSNPQGEFSAIAVASESNLVYLSNYHKWVQTDLELSEHGDRQGVVSIYPAGDDMAYGAAYKYVNAYNKGIYVIKTDFKQERVEQGLLFNSEDRNIGFDIDTYVHGDEVIISGKNSSDNEAVYFQLAKNDFSLLSDAMPEYMDSYFYDESPLAVLAGTGVSQVFWNAKSEVKQDDDVVADVEYEISDALFITAQFEGRWQNTQLAVTYLQNKVEDYAEQQGQNAGGSAGGNLAKRASSYLFSTLDINGLFSKSSSLRLVAETGETQGVAVFKRNDQLVSEQEFKTKFLRIAALNMRERGFYWGLEYVNFRMPSAVGFSDQSKNIVYTDFDNAMKMTKASLLFGFDMLAYAKRYETNFKKFYISGNAGVGIGYLKISDEVEDAAKQQTGKTSINLPTPFAIDGMLELGYLVQQRAKSLFGMGYSASIGYRGKLLFLNSGQSVDDEDSSIEANELETEFERLDIWHGPFAQVNLIF